MTLRGESSNLTFIIIYPTLTDSYEYCPVQKTDRTLIHSDLHRLYTLSGNKQLINSMTSALHALLDTCSKAVNLDLDRLETDFNITFSNSNKEQQKKKITKCTDLLFSLCLLDIISSHFDSW